MKKIALIFCLLLGSIGIARFTHRQTLGFRISKIQDNFCEGKTFASSEAFDEKIFSQPYHFLGRGLQSFVFESEDGNYVIKIFNNRYQNLIRNYGFLSHFPLINSWARERLDYFQSKLIRTFTSYEIAHRLLFEESAIVFTHLNRSSNLPPLITISDPLHINHTLDPNALGFIVQKRVEMVYPTLAKYIEKGEIDLAKKALVSLVDLFICKYQKGISDNDPLIRTNYGFLEQKAIQIDLGPFSEDPKILDPVLCQAAIQKSMPPLRLWLKERAPELCPFLDETIASGLCTFFDPRASSNTSRHEDQTDTK